MSRKKVSGLISWWETFQADSSQSSTLPRVVPGWTPSALDMACRNCRSPKCDQVIALPRTLPLSLTAFFCA